MLQTFAADGTAMVRLNDRIAKFFGVASVGWDYTGAAQSGTVTDARFTSLNCQPFAFVISGVLDLRGGAVQLTVSGNVLTWYYPRSNGDQYARPDATFIYGAF